MEVQTETYTRLPSPKQSRMKIDSLLNPPTDSTDRVYPSGSPYSRHATLPSLHSNYTHPPGYPSSPNGYWYGRYSGYHDTSPSAASTATTHVSSSSSASMPQHQHQHHSAHHNTFMPYHPGGSITSSPDPYQPRERCDSVSSFSSTSGGTDRRRPPRPKYEEEEMYFIWYHRVDLHQEWREVRESFNRQFPARQRRGFQGIQCKFYRFIKDKKCPTLREQRRMRDGSFMSDGTSLANESRGGKPQFGLVEWTRGVWYPWMKEDRETMRRRQALLSS